MFKSTIVCALTVAAVACAASANAADAPAKGKVYVSAGYAYAQTGEEDGFQTLVGSAGVQVSKHVALEAEGAFGVSEQTYHVSGYDIKVKLNHTAAAYVVGIWPASSDVDYTGRIGYASLKLTGSASGVSVSDEISGLSYGLGFRYFPNGGVNGVRGDITHYNFGDDGDADSFQVAYVRKF